MDRTDLTYAGRDRSAQHQAAVARSLASADASAQRGDYADALAWIDVVEAIGDALPLEYEGKRQTWEFRLAGGSPRRRRTWRAA